MRYHNKSRLSPRQRRHLRVRSRIHGTSERPRLNVYRSSQHIYAQVIDDTRGHTMAAASTLEDDVVGQAEGTTKTDRSRAVGIAVGNRAKELGIDDVVFDRGGFQYHGRVRALADAAREAGLRF